MWNNVIIVSVSALTEAGAMFSLSQRWEGLIWAKNIGVKASSMAAEELKSDRLGPICGYVHV